MLFDKLLDFLKMDEHKEDMDKNPNDTCQQSDISWLPKYYKINGKLYDIDNIDDVNRIPISKARYNINGSYYGIDTILRLHSTVCWEKEKYDLCRACTYKSNEFYNNGLHVETVEEKQQRLLSKRKDKEKKLDHKEHLKRTTNNAIMSFQSAFKYHLNNKIIKRFDMAYSELNSYNQKIAISDIEMINHILNDNLNLSPLLPRNIGINSNYISFAYPKNTKKYESTPYTFLEYIPFTKTYKYSKYPIKLHFSYGNRDDLFQFSKDSAWGELSYSQNGTVGKGELIRWINSNLFIYHFKTIESALVISKIESNITCSTPGKHDILYKL